MYGVGSALTGDCTRPIVYLASLYFSQSITLGNGVGRGQTLARCGITHYVRVLDCKVNIILVWHEGAVVVVDRLLADELGLRDGQKIDDEMFYCILVGSAAQFSAEMALRRVVGEPVPDMTEVDRRLFGEDDEDG